MRRFTFYMLLVAVFTPFVLYAACARHMANSSGETTSTDIDDVIRWENEYRERLAENEERAKQGLDPLPLPTGPWSNRDSDRTGTVSPR